MKFLTISLTLLLIVVQLQAQSIYSPVSAKVIGLADATVAMEGYWSSYRNIAGITSTSGIEVGASYENKYSLPSMNIMAVGITSKLPFGYTAINVMRFGGDIYNEHKATLGYATEIGIIKIGLNVNYLQVSVLDFGVRNAFSFDFGGIASLTPKLKIGAQALNISQSKLGSVSAQRIPTLLKMGVSYTPQEYILFNVELEKDILFPTQLKIGAEYNFLKKFYLRAGMRSASYQTFYGLGIEFIDINWDYALSNHAELGISHSISIHYSLKRR
ncbi:hypothetical protein QYS48_32225 [Marivirga arenosa]|uniref:PorV/PorQ family protein n=1 Tax=Marivirga arenosa TaxID=3059076 RepID=A0AA51N888_9BACT|nr:hypothetical protein [Marivirga sp. ABR2-2]WMN06331.1 hypothetical protein QYS48_32225 [Marivirga sp. ABR2-2]